MEMRMWTKKRKPKIAVVTYFHCLRNVKSTIGAFNLGYHDLELYTRDEGYGLGRELMMNHMYHNGIQVWETNGQLAAMLRRSKADIIWCHNEPDAMVEIAAIPDVRQGRMIIHDCHDLPTLHKEIDPASLRNVQDQEKVACTESDYIFVPTEDYVDLIANKYRIPKEKVIVTYSCLPKTFFPVADYPSVSGLLYCGQVNVPEMNSKLPFRNCLPLFYWLTQHGITSHIYNTTPSANMDPYLIAGACVYQTMRMWMACQQYTRYDYGFVGSPVVDKEIQMCMPNKLFDCIAAGIPLVCFNAKTAGEFIKKQGIGVAAQGWDELEKIPWRDVSFWEAAHKRVHEIRDYYTMENQIHAAFKRIGI